MLRRAIALFAILANVSILYAQSGGPIAQAKAELSPLDQPIAWMTEAKRNFGVVKDYSCTLVSQERVKGVLQEQSYIEFKARTEPFSISMRWLGPEKLKGQEVAFVAGRHNNKMRVKSNFLGSNIVGFVTIDTNDPRVLQHSRHTILEAGLGNMIDQNLKHWQIAKNVGKSRVTVGESKYDKRDCLRVEITALEPAAGSYCCRTVIYLEKESKIPIRIENYDWPREGSPAGDMLEMFSYVGLRFNTGLRDEEFNK
jgi:Protein of unknown function (DUF1571)